LLVLVVSLIGTDGHVLYFPGVESYPFGNGTIKYLIQDWKDGTGVPGIIILIVRSLVFLHTHLSGTGRSDLMDVMLMPVTGNLKLSPGSKVNRMKGIVPVFHMMRSLHLRGIIK